MGLIHHAKEEPCSAWRRDELLNFSRTIAREAVADEEHLP
jgi:hypothetical protein